MGELRNKEGGGGCTDLSFGIGQNKGDVGVGIAGRLEEDSNVDGRVEGVDHSEEVATTVIHRLGLETFFTLCFDGQNSSQ